MARPFFVVLCLCLFSACTQRLICPAYQSAFIYDQDELRKKFSYFLEDSTPKILTASKTKYLIAEPVSYRKKLRSLQTVAMKDVNPKLPDSLQAGFEEGLITGEDGVVPGAELDLAARSVIDSTYIVDIPRDTAEALGDSVYVITKDREVRLLKYDMPDSLIYDESSGRYVRETPKYVVTEVRYNVEQDNYMWYLRKNLVLPDVRLAQLQQTEDKSVRKESKKKKGGFFRNLFKRKKKEPVDSTTIEIPQKAADDFDYVDEGDSTQTQQTGPSTPVKEKKGFSFRKKKEKTAQSPDEAAPVKEKKKKREKKPKKAKDAVKPEDGKEEKADDDDGF